MKRMLAAYLAALLILALPASAGADQGGGPVKLMVVSDIHYLAKPLYEGGGVFLQALRAGDGKLTQYGDELLAALAETVAREAPDALLVTGDLSFNGERQSHEALAAWFAGIEATGVDVWVIPGNHDINVNYPHGFTADGWVRVEAVDEAAFADIYADFMLPAAPGANFSYVADTGRGLRVAMTDVAYYKHAAQTFGLFTAAHRDWLTQAAQAAREAGDTLITATHHSLLAHTAFATDSFLMFGHEAMEAAARQGGVALNLSGHLHIQHIAARDGFADAALGAFSVWPHRYAVVTFEDGALRYEAKALDGALLPEGLPEESREWFASIAGEKARASLQGLDASEADIDAMADFAARFNLAFFAGTYSPDDPAWQADPGWAVWQKYPDSLFGQYMALVMEEEQGENLTFDCGL